MAWGKTEERRDAIFQRKREALISEAARAFARRNFYEITMDQIASDLGVTKPTLYHYVESKYELLYECHRRGLNFGERAMSEAEAQPTKGLEKLRYFLQRYMSLLLGFEGHSTVVHYLEALSEAQRQELLRRRQQLRARVKALMRAGQRDGSVGAVDPMAATMLIVGALIEMNSWFREDGRFGPEEAGRRFAEMICTGLVGERS